MRYDVDLTGAGTRAQMHDALKSGLGLPDWYGRNMDALWDALTEMETPCEVVVRGAEKLPEDWKNSITEILEEAAAWHGAQGRRMEIQMVKGEEEHENR